MTHVHQDADDVLQNTFIKVFRNIGKKAVFLLRYYDNMPYKEMEKVLDTSIGALKASYHHAVKKIEHYIKHSDR